MRADVKILFSGNETAAYRDPACIFADGEYRLFFTKSVLDGGYMFNTVAYSHGKTVDTLSEPTEITVRDRFLNYCSPGCVFPSGGEYLIPITSYPLPKPYREDAIATADARIFLIRTKDFLTFSDPEPIFAKGDTPLSGVGRMIDPYLFRDRTDKGLVHLFFKQNGVSHSVSRDLVHWEFLGRIDGGENSSVYEKDGVYHLYHSPENGVGHKISTDLVRWTDLGVSLLGAENEPFCSGRITAGFFMEAPPGERSPYLLFFHGSRAECPPETHGAASLAVLPLERTDLP